MKNSKFVPITKMDVVLYHGLSRAYHASLKQYIRCWSAVSAATVTWGLDGQLKRRRVLRLTLHPHHRQDWQRLLLMQRLTNLAEVQEVSDFVR